ncbi:MAG: tryptophan--tRNA ligase [Nitrososphaeria archaeon]
MFLNLFNHPSSEMQGSNALSDNVTPWSVEGEVDYDKLVRQFGTRYIDEEILNYFKKFTGEINFFLKRNFFFCHRDLDWVLKKYEEGEKFYLYTGRGPSGKVHIGHLLPWFFTKYLQDKFNVHLLFQVTDDEKFLYKDELSLPYVESMTSDNLLDIIAVGFDYKKTQIIIDTKEIKELYTIAIKIAKSITLSTVKAVFGFTDSSNIGMIFFPSIQAAPCFLYSEKIGKPVPCLIPAAIDQDNFWRMTRDVAEKLGYYKPAQIHSKFLPALNKEGKMSSSLPETAIYTTDSPEDVRRKVKNAFTGGQPTIEEQRKKGGNPYICPVYFYEQYFFEKDDKKLEDIRSGCLNGNLLCGEHKNSLISKIITFLEDFQIKREKAKNIVEKYIFDPKREISL